MSITWKFILIILSAQAKQEYAAREQLYIAQIKVLLEQLGGKPRRFTDTQRASLASIAKQIGRKILFEITTLVTPDTLLGWHKRLIKEKWTYAQPKRACRPRIKPETEQLVIRMLTGNPSWGSDRVVGELRKLKIHLADSTIDNIRKRNGIPPAPQRNRSTWKDFLSYYKHAMVGADFFTTEVLTSKGLLTYYSFFAIDLRTRTAHICGTTLHPHGQWMSNIARNLTDCFSGFLTGKTHFIRDRDTKFSHAFTNILTSAGVKTVLCPVMAPKCNAFAERFVRTIKHECLNKVIFFSEKQLIYTIQQFADFYNTERPHQGIGNNVIQGDFSLATGDIKVKKRLGGMLKSYYRKAA